MFSLSGPGFVARLLSRANRACTPAARHQPCRPALELLEDRLVMTGPVAASVTLGYMTDSSTTLNVLQYDSDPNRGATLNPASVTIVTPPQFGQALPNPSNGMILYTPNTLPSSTPDSFQYTVTDSLGLTSNVATVTLNGVSPTAGGFVVAQPLTASTQTLQPVSINVFPYVQVNDGSAVDPTSVKILGVTQTGPQFNPTPTGPPLGSVAVDPATGIVTYTPAFGFVGFEILVYNVESTAGHVSANSSIFVAVYPKPPRLQADPLGGTMLVVDGTPGNDTIDIYPGPHKGDVLVTLNGVTSGPFQPTDRIVAFGYGGNNHITVSPDIQLPAWLDGGDGNNVLVGGGGNNVLLGGAGNDTLIGRGNRELLIGGSGQDTLVGLGRGDILISGSTSFDTNQTALAAILSEWASRDSYRQRVDDLTDVSGPGFGSRLNGNFFLVPATIQQDDVSNLVVVGPGRDLLFVKDSGPNADIIVELRPHERDFDDGRVFVGSDGGRDEGGPGATERRPLYPSSVARLLSREDFLRFYPEASASIQNRARPG
jgi:hypothetical protein